MPLGSNPFCVKVTPSCLKAPSNHDVNGNFEEKYKLGSLTGKWSNGDIWFATERKGNSFVEAKIERREEANSSQNASSLTHEYELYKELAMDKNVPGFQKLHYFGLRQGRKVLVLDYLPWSLSYLARTHYELTCKSVLMVGIQALDRIRYLHHNGWIHGDINPDNIFFKQSDTTLYLTNFHQSRRFRSGSFSGHFPEETRPSQGAYLHFMSRHMHNGIVPSRRDDLESLGYCLVHILKGCLPWSQLGRAQEKEISTRKSQILLRNLRKGKTKCLQPYFSYVLSLKFTEKPDYIHLKAVLRKALRLKGQEEDFRFDWTA